MSCYNLMGVVLKGRRENATKVQDTLTKHGCLIKVRLGLHEAGDACSNDGFLVLQLCGKVEEIEAFKSELNTIPGVVADFMTINA